LALHGGGGTAAAMDRSTNGQFGREAARRGWLVAFPQGVAKGWNDGRPLTSRRDRQRRGVDDVAFLGALIDRIHTTHGIDRSRVYATGISNGGFMSFRLGLELSAQIAAIAPVTANLARAHDGKRPDHPVGLLVINGTADPLVPYAGGHVRVLGRSRGAIHSTAETMRRWAAFNGCAGRPKATPLPDRTPRDGTRAYVHDWPSCATGAAVRLVRIEGGGHTWPGGRAYLPRFLVGAVCRDFEAVPLIFEFFARHVRKARPAARVPLPPGPPAAPRPRGDR
jgi:polyhydroxybutyrate depolymerase